MLDRLFSIDRMIITLVVIAFLMTLFTGYETWVTKNNKDQFGSRASASSVKLSTDDETLD